MSAREWINTFCESYGHKLNFEEIGRQVVNQMQFAMDARCSPERIFYAHPPDQRTEVRLDLGPPSPRAGLPNANSRESQPDANAAASRGG